MNVPGMEMGDTRLLDDNDGGGGSGGGGCGVGRLANVPGTTTPEVGNLAVYAADG